MLVLAGPGSGKTHVISQRIRYLIEEKKVEPESILTITFTKAAAKEMKSRSCIICPSAGRVVYGTFHSVFYHILRTSDRYRNITLIDEPEKIKIMRRLLPLHDRTEQQKIYACQRMLRKISLYKNSWPENQESEEFLDVYKRYTTVCMEQEKVDFDDMLLLCHNLFLTCPSERDIWQERFSYILVDEFQDVNGRQYEIVKMLASKKRNLFVVGDDDQAIYSFRGSNPRYMKKFLEDFPESRIVCLEENFRCGETIVNAACKCIVNNEERFDKKIRPACNFENRVCLRAYESKDKEVEDIMSQIEMRQDDSTAVLVRTNIQAEYIAEKFWDRNLCCQIQQKRMCFYDNSWVQDIMAALRFCVGGQKRSDFLVFMNKPYRGIVRAMLHDEKIDLKELYKLIKGQGQTETAEDIRLLYKNCLLMRKMDAYGAVMLVLGGMHYRSYLNETAGNDAEMHKQMQEMISGLLDRAKNHRTVLQFLQHADAYIKQFAEDNIKKPTGRTDIPEGNMVHIMTYHASKGLEFDRVFMPMLNSGIVPHGHMLTSSQMEEERRMFYVAMTRAKKELHLSYYGKNKDKDASVFFNEVSEDEIST